MCRVLGENPMLARIVPLSWQSWLVARVCLAYQAYRSQSHRYQFPRYLGQALDQFKSCLKRNEIHGDEILVTGLLLCSVSVSHFSRSCEIRISLLYLPTQISTLLLWTAHLPGLEAIIRQRNLHHPIMQRDSLTQFFVEGIGLLDLPGATLGRRNPCRHIWRRLITPLQRSGIEPTTGLPRSLLDIMAHMDIPEAEEELLSWTPSDRAEHVLQYPFWEAFRLTTMLMSRSLTSVKKSDSLPRQEHSLDANTESIVMRILSCIKALQSATEDPFHIPLRCCILWPLFTAALHTDAASPTRALFSQEYRTFLGLRNKPVDRTAWAVLLEVWTQRDSDPTLQPLKIAHDFASDMGVELHLY